LVENESLAGMATDRIIHGNEMASFDMAKILFLFSDYVPAAHL